jgi:fatty-acyl-CoA synthase
MVHSTMMQVPLSVSHLLERSRWLFGKREIVSRLPDRSITRTSYAALYDRARRLAAALVRERVKPGEPVGTLMWNSIWHMEAYFGIPASGAVLHTLNLRLSPQDLAHIIKDAGDRIVIVDDTLLPLLEQVLSLVSIERIVVVPTGGSQVTPRYANYEEFIVPDAVDFMYPALDENAPCGMCYTSGTTGRPKGVDGHLADPGCPTRPLEAASWAAHDGWRRRGGPFADRGARAAWTINQAWLGHDWI